MLSEAQIRQYAWESSTKRIVAMIEEYATGWAPNGPCKATADAILKKIRAMPVPGPAAGDQQ
jgi:hypothetical protein